MTLDAAFVAVLMLLMLGGIVAPLRRAISHHGGMGVRVLYILVIVSLVGWMVYTGYGASFVDFIVEVISAV